MLDDEKGIARLAIEAADGRKQLLEQGAVHAGGDLIQQDDARLGHHGAAQFQKLLLTAGEIAGRFVHHMGKIEKIQNLAGTGAHLRLPVAHQRGAKPGGQQALAGLMRRHDHEVFQRGHGCEGMGNLKGAHKPLVKEHMGGKAGDVLTVKKDPARIRAIEPGNDVEQRGLAGAIGADEAGDRACLHLQRTVIDGAHAPETQGHVDHLQRGRHGRPSSSLVTCQTSRSLEPHFPPRSKGKMRRCGAESALTLASGGSPSPILFPLRARQSGLRRTGGTPFKRRMTDG